MNTSLIAWMPGPLEWTVIVIVALLIFGRRLPDVARSVGKSIVEFKKGMRDVKDEIDERSRLDNSKQGRMEQRTEDTDNAGKAPTATKEDAHTRG